MEKYKPNVKGRVVTYEITIKHRGELSENFLKYLKDDLWEYFGDIARKDITIKKKVWGQNKK